MICAQCHAVSRLNPAGLCEACAATAHDLAADVAGVRQRYTLDLSPKTVEDVRRVSERLQRAGCGCYRISTIVDAILANALSAYEDTEVLAMIAGRNFGDQISGAAVDHVVAAADRAQSRRSAS